MRKDYDRGKSPLKPKEALSRPPPKNRYQIGKRRTDNRGPSLMIPHPHYITSWVGGAPFKPSFGLSGAAGCPIQALFWLEWGRRVLAGCPTHRAPCDEWAST